MNVTTNIKYGVRPIQDGKKYEKYFDVSLLKNDDKINFEHKSVQDTLKYMELLANKYKDDTAKITKILKGKTLRETLFNIHRFIVENIQYSKDAKTLEQVCRPLRLWVDRDGSKGHTDCDCMSVFISSILVNLKIPHAYRMAGYNGGEFQHVYVIVYDKKHPKGYYTVDGVVHDFDIEVAFSKNEDKKVNMAIQILDGIPENTGQQVEEKQIFTGHLFGISEAEKPVEITQDEKAFLLAFKNHLIGSITLLQGSQENDLLRRQMLYIISQMGSLKLMIKALKFLARKKNFWQKILGEIQSNNDLLSGLEEMGRKEEIFMLEGNGIISRRYTNIDDDEETGLGDFDDLGDLSGKASRQQKKVAKQQKKEAKKEAKKQKQVAKKEVKSKKKADRKAKQQVKKQQRKERTKARNEKIKKGFKKFGAALKKGFKAIGKFIQRWNPLSITIRGGILLALKINFANIGYKVGIGRLSWETAQKLGISQAHYEKCKQANAKMEKVFIKVFAGKMNNLHKCAMQGLKKKLKKLRINVPAGVNLGEPLVTAAAIIGAAAAALAPIIDMCKGFNPSIGGQNADAEGGDTNEKVDVNSPEVQEVSVTEYSDGKTATNPSNWQSKAANLLEVGTDAFKSAYGAVTQNNSSENFSSNTDDQAMESQENTDDFTQDNTGKRNVASTAPEKKSGGVNYIAIAAIFIAIAGIGYVAMRK